MMPTLERTAGIFCFHVWAVAAVVKETFATFNTYVEVHTWQKKGALKSSFLSQTWTWSPSASCLQVLLFSALWGEMKLAENTHRPAAFIAHNASLYNGGVSQAK